MTLNDLLKNTSEWIKGAGPDSEIVISSRVRFARNLSGIPFTHWASQQQRRQVLKTVKSALDSNNYFKKSLFLKVDELAAVDKQFLVEKRLISRELASGSDSKAVDISDKEIFSIMVNEEDHLRMQVMQSGLNLEEALRLMDTVDNDLAGKLNYAYDANWGYLTACPTNVGTGMRASVMLHLPALVMGKRVKGVLMSIAKLNLAVRGLYGEGTEAAGNFFQVSNQVTLGHSEQEIVDNLQRVIRQIIDYEQGARDNLFSNSRTALEDKIWRAYGVLSNAYIITSKETIDLLSIVRLGVNLKIISNLDIKTINELFIITQPAHLQKLEGKELNPQERDVKRAEIIKKKLKTT